MTSTNIDQQLDQSTAEVCPVCRSSSYSVVYPAARDYITGVEFQVRSCGVCNVARTFPVPSDLEPHYPRYYRRYNRLAIATLQFFYRLRVSRWSRRYARPGSALEVGCGNGSMLNALRSLGWKVAGTERTDEMAQFAREHFGLTVYVGGAQAIPHTEKFDLVVLFHVLEHLADPVEQLKSIAKHLTPTGAVVVGVPNMMSWQSYFAKEKWVYLDVPRHLMHFSFKSIESVADQADLKVSRLSFSSFEHDPYGWVQSLLNSLFGNGNRLMSLLMRATPWRARDIVTAALAILLVPPAICLSLVSWPFKRGGVMEAWLTLKSGE